MGLKTSSKNYKRMNSFPELCNTYYKDPTMGSLRSN